MHTPLSSSSDTSPEALYRARVFLGLIPAIIVNAVLPLVAYTILTGRGWSPVGALSASAVFPVIAMLVSIARTRGLDGLALITLILIVLGLLGSLVSGSPRFHLVKESVLTGAFGIACAVSLVLPRPLAFFFGRQFATAGDSARVQIWNSYWVYPQFRRVQYTITGVWAAGLLLDAGLRVVLSLVLPVADVVWLSPAIFYAGLFALLMWMFSYIGRARARASAAGVETLGAA
jgi:intracellular septation protein A